MIDSPARAVDIIKARMTAAYDTNLQAVCTERGVDYDDASYPMAVKFSRSTVRHEDMDGYDYPFSWVQAVPDGHVLDRGSNTVTTRNEVMCFIADRHQDGDILAARLQCHLVALARTFNVVRSPDGDWEALLTDWTGTPPDAPADLWVGSVGVQIDVTIIEALD